MELSYLNYIIEVAKVGSITKAAQKLFISQPYLSRIIKEIEEEINVIIFIRTSQGVILTPQGKEFVSYAKAMMKEYRNIVGLSNKQEDMSNRFFLTTVRSSLVMESFIKLMGEYEGEDNLRFTIKETESEKPIHDVHYLNADLGILYIWSNEKTILMEELSRKNIEYRKICKFKPCVILGANHPLLKEGREIDKESIYKYGLVRYGKDYMPYDGERASFDYYKSFLDMDRIKKVISVCDRASLHNILTQTDFFTLGTQAAVEQAGLFNIISIPVKSLEKYADFEMGIIYQREMVLNPIAKRFVQILIENYGEIKQ